MEIRYRVIALTTDNKIICYELNIYYEDTAITIYFTSTHFPNKRFTKKRPIDYFMRVPTLKICVTIIPIYI